MAGHLIEISGPGIASLEKILKDFDLGAVHGEGEFRDTSGASSI